MDTSIACMVNVSQEYTSSKNKENRYIALRVTCKEGPNRSKAALRARTKSSSPYKSLEQGPNFGLDMQATRMGSHPSVYRSSQIPTLQRGAMKRARIHHSFRESFWTDRVPSRVHCLGPVCL